MNMMRFAAAAGVATLATSGVLVAPAAADEGAEILHPECGFTSDTFPGVDVEIQAFYCQVVLTPGGTVNAVLRARIPDGYPIPAGVYRGEPCTTVVTPTGLIMGTCHF